MQVPTHGQVVCYLGAGGPEVIAFASRPVAAPGPGEVTVQVAAAGLNRADVLQRKGRYPAPPGTVADVPGLEFAGTVVALGLGVRSRALGDRVMGIVAGGAMAEYLVAHEREVVPVPTPLTWAEAAAVPEAFFTAWDALHQAGAVLGEAVLVHAATSGVGTAAMQLIRTMGGRAIGTGRQADKLAQAETRLGPGGTWLHVVDGRFAEAVAAHTGGHGANVILDCVGGAYFEENVRALASRGRLVLLGTLGGATASAPLAMLLGKRANVIGTVLRARPLEEKIALAQRVSAQLMPLFAAGTLSAVVDSVMPMSEIARAHARMEADENVGKIVLTWSPLG